MNASGRDNQFVATFYNRFAQNMRPDMRAFYKDNVPKTITVKHHVPTAGKDDKGQACVKNGVAQ